MSNLYIMHYGVGHDKGGHSGRYPWGSGENPYGGKGTKSIYKSDKVKRAKSLFIGGAIGGAISGATGNTGNNIDDMAVSWAWKKMAEDHAIKNFNKKYGNLLNEHVTRTMMEMGPFALMNPNTSMKTINDAAFKSFINHNPEVKDSINKYKDLLIKNRREAIDDLTKLANKYDLRTLYSGDGKVHPFTSKNQINNAKNI